MSNVSARSSPVVCMGAPVFSSLVTGRWPASWPTLTTSGQLHDLFDVACYYFQNTTTVNLEKCEEMRNSPKMNWLKMRALWTDFVQRTTLVHLWSSGVIQVNSPTSDLILWLALICIDPGIPSLIASSQSGSVCWYISRRGYIKSAPSIRFHIWNGRHVW